MLIRLLVQLLSLPLALVGSPFQEEGERVEFAVVTHAKNPVKALSRAAFAKCFKAQTRYWKRGRRIHLLMPRSDTPMKDFLLEEVYEMSELELKQYWLRLVYQNKLPEIPKVMPSTAVALAVAKSQPGALAIVEAKDVEGRKDVSVLKIDGKKPGDPGYWPSALRKVADEDKEKVEEKKEKDGDDAEDESGSDGGGDDSHAGIYPGIAGHVAAAGFPPLPAPPPDDDLRERVAVLEEQLAAGMGLGGASGLSLGGVALHGFADVTFRGVAIDSDDPGAQDGSSSFGIGQLDLFLTSQLSEELSFLNETVFETDQDGEAVVDVERLILKYDFGDAVNLQVGRMHTTFGYWNTTYHHGEWLQASIGRPRILDFEDEDGLLPVHIIGLSLDSYLEVGLGELETTLEVGNGRGPTPDELGITEDGNDMKAANLSLILSPAAVEGLRVGAGAYVDEIPPNADAAKGPTHGSLDELILNASAAYVGDDWLAAVEYFHIEHDATAGGSADTNGFYVQLERALGRAKPYARFEGVDVSDTDPYFESVEDLVRYSVGVRWDLNAWNAIKLQLSHSRFEAGPGGFDRDETAVTIQTAVAF